MSIPLPSAKLYFPHSRESFHPDHQDLAHIHSRTEYFEPIWPYQTTQVDEMLYYMHQLQIYLLSRVRKTSSARQQCWRESFCNSCYLTHSCCKFYNVAFYAICTDIFCVENPAVRKVFAFSDCAERTNEVPPKCCTKMLPVFWPQWSWIDAKNGTYIVSYIPQNY